MSSMLPSLSPSLATAVMPRICTASSVVGTVALLVSVKVVVGESGTSAPDAVRGVAGGAGADTVALNAALADAVLDGGGVGAAAIVAARHERGHDAQGRQRDVQHVVRAVDRDDPEDVAAVDEPDDRHEPVDEAEREGDDLGRPAAAERRQQDQAREHVDDVVPGVDLEAE